MEAVVEHERGEGCAVKYEYRILHLPGPPTDPMNEAYLNGEGRLGWEMVAATAIEVRARIGSRMESRLEQICYMKRVMVEPDA